MNNEIDLIKQAAKRLTQSQLAKGFKQTGLYLYCDANGVIIYARIRMDKDDGTKWIRPISRDDEGNWTQLKEPDFKQFGFANGKPLYGADLLAKLPSETVYLVEGEKCADTLNKHSLLAVTFGGVSGINDADLQPLADREVIIWADNDVAGLECAKTAHAKLSALGCDVKMIDVSKLGLDAKGDCVDWLQTHDPIEIENLPMLNHAMYEPVSVSNSENTTSTDDAEIKALADLTPLEYDRVRNTKAKGMGVQVKTLDALVKAERESNEQSDSAFAEIEPWDMPINPAKLLDELTLTIQRFIIMDKQQAQAASLWIAACWFIDVIDCAPIALINAPEKACGKTQLLTVMGKLAPRPAQASGISPSVLFRMIEAYQPTLFIDEIETVLHDNEDLRGLLNAGHTRDSAYVWRSVAKGDDFEPRRFSVWGMKAIAGINAIKLAETVTSRSIVIELRRKTQDEKVERLRRAEPELFKTLSSKLARFADDYADAVKKAVIDLPEALSDREQDNWEPLMQIASVAGGHWLDTALRVALKLSGATQTSQSSANELLTDIQEIFDAKNVIKITTSDLLIALCEDDEKSWATYNRGKQLTARQLSNKLRVYGISSKDIRFVYEGVKKGYEAEQFKDAFKRYLNSYAHNPPENAILSATPLQANRHGV
jgi:putative DNA primase/helicase